jgi:hypothetical protein
MPLKGGSKLNAADFIEIRKTEQDLTEYISFQALYYTHENFLRKEEMTISFRGFLLKRKKPEELH